MFKVIKLLYARADFSTRRPWPWGRSLDTVGTAETRIVRPRLKWTEDPELVKKNKQSGKRFFKASRSNEREAVVWGGRMVEPQMQKQILRAPSECCCMQCEGA